VKKKVRLLRERLTRTGTQEKLKAKVLTQQVSYIREIAHLSLAQGIGMTSESHVEHQKEGVEVPEEEEVPIEKLIKMARFSFLAVNFKNR